MHELAEEARRVAQMDDPALPLRRELKEIERKVDKAGELALKMEDPEPMLRMIEKLRREQELLEQEIRSLDKESAVREALANITDDQVATILRDAVEPTALLNTVVSKITLDPDTHECQIHYELPMWLSVASPRGLIRIAFGRSSPLRGAHRASKTLSRFVEPGLPRLSGHAQT